MKASILTIKFEPNWILNNQVSGRSSVIDDVVKKIKEKYQSESVFVINKEFHQCKIIVACDQTLVEKETLDDNEIRELLGLQKEM